ncbi:AraC-like ligand binding domain-containing protein [Anaerocolumna jejuensis DSM 15929]|uniref:AraC-like ligand binding domain-containing protein n=1 Tax=Anaerocolumna jejuensis DSM 15929 TaxID=1121322 RepID=A0A1M6YWT4_9FIRM|nr:AraC family transcriptional regulator [Anaerocolumna jejuensis]SHL22555.1 AraC-like ligand binding domain-containing protein [Anaerocolumna jejuensis DSM 15929]
MLFSYDADVLPQVRLIGRIRYTEPWIHFYRVIDEYILYVIRNGEMYLKEGNMRYTLKKGDMFLLEPNLPHEGYQRAVCDYYYVHFKHSALKNISQGEEKKALQDLSEKRMISLASFNLDSGNVTDSLTCLPKLFSLPNQEFQTTLKQAIDIYNKREEHYKRIVSTQFHLFLLQAAHEHLMNSGTGQNPPHIRKSETVAEKILRYLNCNYSQKINSSLIEKQFEVNFDYINRIFSELTGNTIFSYLNSLRIEHAKELLATTSLPFGDIGYLVGIDDRYYFTKQFKKYTGMTPTEYFEHIHRMKKDREFQSWVHYRKQEVSPT